MASAQDNANLQSQNLLIREHLNNAYAAVEGQKAVQSFSAFTFEDALDQQIERIAGASTDTRPNELDRVSRVESDVVAAVAQVKALPPNAFVEPDDERDVNTKP
jgi:hypothetical protein